MTSVSEVASQPDLAADFRGLMSSFPTGVAVVTATGSDGTPRGMTCTSLSSVTLHPPTLLVCLNTNSGTLAAVRFRGQFAVNLLHANGREAAEVFATPDVDRFDRVPWRISPAGSPWLTEHAFAVAECLVADTYRAGDHDVIFGEVFHVRHCADVPLLYGLRQFSSWLPEVGG